MPKITLKEAIANNPERKAKALACYKARVIAYGRTIDLHKKQIELCKELQAIKEKGIVYD